MGRRRSYDERSRSNTEAAKILANAFCREIEFTTNEQGDRVRVWRADELQTFKHDDIANAIRRRRALEQVELLEEIPPTAIKYAVTKRWLIQSGGLYFVTDRAAAELSLPRKDGNGATIRFAKA